MQQFALVGHVKLLEFASRNVCKYVLAICCLKLICSGAMKIWFAYYDVETTRWILHRDELIGAMLKQ